jgi:hypothetical protein
MMITTLTVLPAEAPVANLAPKQIVIARAGDRIGQRLGHDRRAVRRPASPLHGDLDGSTANEWRTPNE